MFNKFYEQELQNLRQLAVEFSKAHPATAPMLSGPTADPDAERLLEGVAFLTGLLHQKTRDDFPEVIHALLNVIFPHYLRPIPSTSIVVFYPKDNLPETTAVKKGTSLASVPVDGTPCLFRTAFDIDVHPLRLAAVELTQTGQSSRIRLQMELTGPDLSRWRPKRLGFFLGGSHTEATDLFMLLAHYLDRIVLTPADGGQSCTLPASALTLSGFDMKNNLLSYPTQAFAGYRILHEYFVLPRKFTFFELHGWDEWIDRGKGKQFDIIFELRQAPVAPPKVTRDHFILNATPVVNLFPHEADPFVFDHRLEKIRVQPAGKNSRHYQVFSVDSVTGYAQGSVAQKQYAPLELFQHQNGRSAAYEVSYARSPITDAPEVHVSFAYPADGAEPVKETLSIDLTCTNGELPERLQLGDISVPTSDSPGLLTFKNVLPPTSSIDPPLGNNAAWRFLAHLSLNYLPLANVENLRELLQLYLFPEARDKTKVAANIKRIEGITGFQTAPADRLVRGMVLRGQELTLSARQDHFAGLGDLYLFGAVMDAFLGVYSSINTFTKFELKEQLSGESFSWPAKLGDRPLI